MKTVGEKLEAFSVPAAKPGFNHHEENGVSAFETITEASFPGKWKVIYFYPKDFTFVCPTEIVEFAKLNNDLKDRDAVLMGGSTDNEFCKLAWRREHKDLDKLNHYASAMPRRAGRHARRARQVRWRCPARDLHRRSGQHDPARVGQQPERRPQPDRKSCVSWTACKRTNCALATARLAAQRCNLPRSNPLRRVFKNPTIGFNNGISEFD
jgi:hypothetical protein